MIRRVHMVEPLGRGGVFNHTLEVVTGLLDLNVDVVLHTATDPEAAPAGVRMCQCVSWYRNSKSRFVRRSRTTLRYVGRTLPHLCGVFGSDDVVHIQGMFALTPEVISVARLRGSTVVCSPHNTFARDRALGQSRVLDHVLRRSDRVLVYSDADVATLAGRVSEVGRVPLVQWTPPVDPAQVAAWRADLAPNGLRLALMPGYLRPDKNVDVFVRAMTLMPPGWRGAVVGEDMGPGADLDRLVRDLDAPVTTRYRYLDVDEFLSLIAAADVIAAPYQIASQSGVLSVAARLGVPRATAPIGGLGELATAVATEISPEALRDAILAAYEIGSSPATIEGAAQRFLSEYVVAHDARRHPQPQRG
jgi:glycosyltransferase involved in cell wall biosynthesis